MVREEKQTIFTKIWPLCKLSKENKNKSGLLSHFLFISLKKLVLMLITYLAYSAYKLILTVKDWMIYSQLKTLWILRGTDQLHMTNLLMLHLIQK